MNGLMLKLLVVTALLVGLVGLVLAGSRNREKPAGAAGSADSGVDVNGPWQAFEKPSETMLREALGALQFKVTQENGTEAPFRNAYWDNHEAGIYVDVVSGEPLFSSLDKFESGTGWPSFVRPLLSDNVTEHEDSSFGMRRVEVRSTHADSHLGHLFNDGPAPTGLRYCINSASLRFIPASELKTEGYEGFLALFQPGEAEVMTTPEKTETATLAGGCFWGMEDIIRDIPGVIDTDVGYTGGQVEDATYKDVRTGKSGHAEAIQVVFDPDRVSYEVILGFFFRMHDPTTKNRQGNDVGTQYRSAIFFHDDAQRAAAERVKKEVDASGKWKKPIVTEIVPAGRFYVAKGYHQDYLEKNPNGYTCHYLRD